MPGPGGPGPAEERALAARIDARLLEQQVLVVAFPDTAPEVYIACADQERRGLLFCEAGVTSGGAVDLGSERLVPLTDIGSVRVDEGTLTILGHDHQMLVQMHFEEVEPHLVWAQGLRNVIGNNGNAAAAAAAPAGPDAEDDEDGSGEMHMLQARSRQLQNKIGTLEAVNERRDKQLNKMVKRLDGAMQMLEAVEGMCGQQRKVIYAQKTAIDELQRDLGMEVQAESPEQGKQSSPKASGGARVASPKATHSRGAPEADSEEDSPEAGGEGEEGEEEMAANAEKMMGLLAQAEQMQQMLQMLEARGADMGADLGSEDSGSPGGLPGPSALAASLAQLMKGVGGLGGGQHAPPQDEDDDEDEEEEEDEDDEDDEPAGANEAQAVERLQGLEAEKARFENMLQDSQSEHQDLLEKLNGMRSLMSALGMQQSDLDDLDDTNN